MFIDLHLHTTASDGRLTPTALIRMAASGGAGVLAVTDHDTTAGFAEAFAEARRAGVRMVSGIELSTSRAGADVHLLGYFFDPDDEPLQAFLRGLREARTRRFHTIGERLAALGMPVDAAAIAAARPAARSLGRPQLADAMVAAGYVASARQAFDLFLGAGRPAYVPRIPVTQRQAIEAVHHAGGIVSLAHPGLLRRDEWIASLVDDGIDAIEVYHSDHSDEVAAHYRDVAARVGLATTGGSDFHASSAHGGRAPGSVTLPPEEFARLEELAAHRLRRQR